MRILIFSDLHANLAALQALQRVEAKPDALLFLGDAVGYGPDPEACVAWLKNNATLAVQGDHDRAVAMGSEPLSPPDWLDLARATCAAHRMILSASASDYLRKLPVKTTAELGGARFLLSHRAVGIADPFTDSDAALQKAFALDEADVFLFGHTHIPLLRQIGMKKFVNPGSLGQPRHGLPSATFAVWDDGDIRIQHIDYDPLPTVQKLSLLALDPEQIDRLKETLLRGL